LSYLALLGDHAPIKAGFAVHPFAVLEHLHAYAEDSPRPLGMTLFLADNGGFERRGKGSPHKVRVVTIPPIERELAVVDLGTYVLPLAVLQDRFQRAETGHQALRNVVIVTPVAGAEQYCAHASMRARRFGRAL
jgi:hypothetical protein